MDGIRYAHIAQTINQSGNWTVLYDEFKDAEYNNKPPLLLWLVAASIKTFGFSTFAVKLPSALFVFGGLLLLWSVVTKFYGHRAAFFAVFLFCANRVFLRAIIDLNFEGMVVCGALLCLRACLTLLRDRKIARSDEILFGSGLFLLLQSKPPYVLFIFVPLAALYVRSTELRRTLRGLLFSKIVVACCLLGISWMLLSSKADMGRMFSNQVSHPLKIEGNYLQNLTRWGRTVLLEFAPLSWLGIWAMLIQPQRMKLPALPHRRLEWFFLLAWAAPAIGVIFFVEHQSRYLIVSFLALTIVGGKLAALLFTRARSRHLARGSAVFGAACFMAFTVLNLRGHQDNGAVAILRRHPELVAQGTVICAAGVDNLSSKPGRKRVSMLLELEFQKKFAVAMYQTLGNTSLQPQLQFIAEDECVARLKEMNARFTTVETVAEFSLLRLDGPLPDITRSGADDRNFHDYF